MARVEHQHVVSFVRGLPSHASYSKSEVQYRSTVTPLPPHLCTTYSVLPYTRTILELSGVSSKENKEILITGRGINQFMGSNASG